jgi:hypothetical protein
MMTNVNGHAALPGLQLYQPAGRADLRKRDLRRRAREVRTENVEGGRRRRLSPPTLLPERPTLKLVHTTVKLEPPAGTLPSKRPSKRNRRPEPGTPATAERKQEPAPAKAPKAGRKTASAPNRAPGTPEQTGGGVGGSKPGRKSPAVTARDSGTKKETVLALLRRPEGATLAELMQATGWQSHSVRGFLSGTLKKKMALQVRSSKRDGVRVYSLRG